MKLITSLIVNYSIALCSEDSMVQFQKPPPLNISCTSTDCDKDLHCFKQLKRMTPEQRGKCRECGANLVDWKRVHRRDATDAEYTFSVLKHELIRHHFFHQTIDDNARETCTAKGPDKTQAGCSSSPRKVPRSSTTASRWSSDTVQRQCHLLRSARDRDMLSNVPRILAQHSQRPTAFARRDRLLCNTN